MKRRGVISNIDTFEHPKFRVKIPIALDKESGKFQAEYQGKYFSSPTLEKIKADIYAFVQRMVSLEWVPVISVHLNGGSRSITDVINDSLHNDATYQRKHQLTSGSLQMVAKRFWIAQRSDGVWMYCEEWDSRDWEAEGVNRDDSFLGSSDRRQNSREWHVARDGFQLPYVVEESFRDGHTHYLPYSENVWAALNSIADRTGELFSQLNQLVATDEGRARLSAFSQRILPPAPYDQPTLAPKRRKVK